MKNIKTVLFFAIILLTLSSGCTDKDVDTVYPEIQMIQPLNCDSVSVGGTMLVKALFTDNKELGSYSIEIHNNFDHHNHSTEANTCVMSPNKTPVNPFTYINSFELDAGLKEKEITLNITVPAQIDTGDYHLVLRLTDKEGWQRIKGLSIKLV